VYIFSGSKVIAEYDNGAAVGSPSREYIYSGGALIAKIDPSGTKYYHQDYLSNRLVTDSTGNTVAQLGHFPYGESWYNASNDKLFFTTYERDSESGNDYAIARYDISRLGRFSSPDPFAGSVSDPQSLNRYAYVRNDPIDLVDPLGLSTICFVYWTGDPEEPVKIKCIDVPDKPPYRPPSTGGSQGGGGTTKTEKKKTDCFAMLKFNSARADLGGATHSFWYVQNSQGQQYIVTARDPQTPVAAPVT
jgi:RHS repeat-associated protein